MGRSGTVWYFLKAVIHCVYWLWGPLLASLRTVSGAAPLNTVQMPSWVGAWAKWDRQDVSPSYKRHETNGITQNIISNALGAAVSRALYFYLPWCCLAGSYISFQVGMNPVSIDFGRYRTRQFELSARVWKIKKIFRAVPEKRLFHLVVKPALRKAP